MTELAWQTGPFPQDGWYVVQVPTGALGLDYCRQGGRFVAESKVNEVYWLGPLPEPPKREASK